MTTKFDVGQKIKFVVEGTVKKINIDNQGISYTITTIDAHNLTSMMYLEEDTILCAENSEENAK